MNNQSSMLSKTLVIGILILFICMSVVSSTRYNATVSNLSGINSKMDSATVLLDENFSGTFPPDGWSTDCWTQSNINCCYSEPPCAYLLPYNQSEYDGYITSKAIDASDYEIVYLRFKIGIWNNHCSFYFEYRMNETSPWKVICPWDNPLTEDICSWLEFEINCSSGNCGDALQMKWTVMSIYNYGWDACLDDVQILGGENQPPDAPIIDGPTYGDPGVFYDYTFVTNDPEGDDITRLYIDWDDGPVQEAEGLFESGEEVIVSHTWVEEGIYYIRAKSRDIHGAESPWSDTYRIVIGNHPPEKPIIKGPTRGKSGVELTYTFVSTDPEGHDIIYCFDWGDGSGGACTLPYPSGEEANASHTWDENGTYIITVNASDIFGAKSESTTLKVKIPRSRTFISNFNLLDWLFERFPLLEVFLRAMNLL